VLGAHEDYYSLVSKLVIRIFVHPEVLLRHRVDAVEAKVFVDANDSGFTRERAIRGSRFRLRYF
jgi:hypothetical protein